MSRIRLLFAALALTSASLAAQANPVPLLYQLSPTSVRPGHAAFTLSVRGNGFVSGATILWNGAALPTTFVNQSLVKASVPAGSVAARATATVTVANTGGIASNPIYFTVRPASSTVTLAASPVKIEPGTVTVADFNGDNIPDVAIDGINENGVYFDTYLGNGHGGFTRVKGPGISLVGPQLCFPNLTGNFNNDYMDVAVCAGSELGEAPDGLFMLLGNGFGQFEVLQRGGQPFTTGQAADMNGDGILDLVTQCDDGMPGLCIYLGNGDGTFTQTAYVNPIFSGYGIPVVGDFNGDGKLDVAIPGNQLGVFLGNGDGTVQGEVDYPMAPVGNVANSLAAVADINRDGKLDIVANTGNVMLGAGDGSFTNSSTIPFAAAGEPNSQVLVADINGDGKLDVVTSVGTNTGSLFSIALGNGDGTFQTPLTFNLGIADSLGMADFNNDGLLDFVGQGQPNDVLVYQK